LSTFLVKDDSHSHLGLVKGVLRGDRGALGVGSLGGGGDGQESGEDKEVAIHGTCRPVVGRAIGVQGLLYRPARSSAKHLLTLPLDGSKRERAAPRRPSRCWAN